METFIPGETFAVKLFNDNAGTYLYWIDNDELQHSFLRANPWNDEEFLHILENIIELPFQENELKEKREVASISDRALYLEHAEPNTWTRQYIIKTF